MLVDIPPKKGHVYNVETKNKKKCTDGHFLFGLKGFTIYTPICLEPCMCTCTFSHQTYGTNQSFYHFSHTDLQTY